jgi:hypothetical protein
MGNGEDDGVGPLLFKSFSKSNNDSNKMKHEK